MKSYLEKENAAKQSALETHKQKAIESTQRYQEIVSNTEKEVSKLTNAQTMLQEKTELLEKEIHSRKRVQEEVNRLKKRLEFYEQHSGGDEGLKEQLQMYKQLLKCSTCHLNDKEVVLTRCFHVFCKNCIEIRINTRQRKCPSCGDSFGINDVHQLYL
jgi:E3 ubiquitin-protein ligase BRE1